jgi:hypothetical protein
MNPHIDGTEFGSITIESKTYTHDVQIGLDGSIQKRKKKLSKAVYGTSHLISLEEARHVHEPGAGRLLVGAGQYGLVTLSDDAAEYFRKQACQVDLLPTKEAINAWNQVDGAVLGLFHVTC